MNDIKLDIQSRPARKKEGLTIVELLAVVAIMAILAGIVLGIAGYGSRRASDAEARADIQLLKNALTEYRMRHGTYPQHNITSMADWEDYKELFLTYVDEVNFEDPWGRAYRYETRGRLSYDLWSWGPTGEEEEYDIIR